MRLGALRPVGEPVPVFPRRGTFDWPTGYRLAWLDSGTTALAVALRASLSGRHADARRVIVPAYTCPDVISAVLWAGGNPLIVDTRPASPWINATELESNLDDSIAAVVAPHFLGIPHPLGKLAELCANCGASLIEDSAQLGPASPAFEASADLVILSFARGKPVPVTGGALLYTERQSPTVDAVLADLPVQRSGALSWRIRILLQNAAMTRLGFAAARLVPSLAVGETRFKPLLAPRRRGGHGSRLAEAVLSSWGSHNAAIEARLGEILNDAGCGGLAERLGWDGTFPLLRFPALAPDRQTRDELVSRLDRDGCGASAFYRVPLAAIDGVPSLDAVGSLPNATSFAGRLFTLPCHSGVRYGDLEVASRGLFRVLPVERPENDAVNGSAELRLLGD